jgi:hypothetical protein
MGGYPPGCTQADVDRAMGGDEECFHEEYESNWEGYATCDRCGHGWWLSAAELEWERKASAAFEAYCRREERRERWRQVRDWFRSLLPRRRAASIDDDLPF